MEIRELQFGKNGPFLALFYSFFDLSVRAVVNNFFGIFWSLARLLFYIGSFWGGSPFQHPFWELFFCDSARKSYFCIANKCNYAFERYKSPLF